jgi:hypothetical protein
MTLQGQEAELLGVYREEGATLPVVNSAVYTPGEESHLPRDDFPRCTRGIPVM